MKTTLIKAAAVLLAAGAVLPASAGSLTYQGVTFTSSWTGNVLTLEIDAAKLRLQTIERGHLPAAGPAPGRPDVEQYDLAAEIGERERLAVLVLKTNVGDALRRVV